MAQRLEGKVAIVTGGTQGVGEGVARRFAQEGAFVIVTSRSPDKGARIEAELRATPGCPGALYLRHDVTVKSQAPEIVGRAVEEFGRLDILVNNAQIVTKWQRYEESDADQMLDISLRSGVFASLWLSQAAFPHMKAQGSGRIINCASYAGAMGLSYQGPYGTGKEAIRGLTRHLANEWGRYGITVNVFLPAARSPNYETLTTSRNRLAETDPQMALQKQKMEATMGYQPFLLGGEDQVGSAIVGIASDAGRFLTGQDFYTDGGIHLWAINHHLNMPGSEYHRPETYAYAKQDAG